MRAVRAASGCRAVRRCRRRPRRRTSRLVGVTAATSVGVGGRDANGRPSRRAPGEIPRDHAAVLAGGVGGAAVGRDRELPRRRRVRVDGRDRRRAPRIPDAEAPVAAGRDEQARIGREAHGVDAVLRPRRAGAMRRCAGRAGAPCRPRHERRIAAVGADAAAAAGGEPAQRPERARVADDRAPSRRSRSQVACRRRRSRPGRGACRGSTRSAAAARAAPGPGVPAHDEAALRAVPPQRAVVGRHDARVRRERDRRRDRAEERGPSAGRGPAAAVRAGVEQRRSEASPIGRTPRRRHGRRRG